MSSVKNFRRISHTDFARSYDRTVERGASIEFTHDAQQHRGILYLSVGIKGGHHAAVAQFLSVNAHVADGDYASRPVAFFEFWYIGKKNVGAQAAMVDIQVARRPVGGDEQRQNVKGLRRRNLLQSHWFASGSANKLQRFNQFQGCPLIIGMPFALMEPCRPSSFGFEREVRNLPLSVRITAIWRSPGIPRE